MNMSKSAIRRTAAAVTLLFVSVTAAAAAERSLEDVRDSLADLLQTMVAKGVVTREQAGDMIMESQRRAEDEVIARDQAAEKQREAAPAIAPAATVAATTSPVQAPTVRDADAGRPAVAPAPDAAMLTSDAEAAKDVARGDVRVTYVPQYIRDEIREQVRAEVTPQVVKEVLSQAKTDKWGVPGALPAWVGNVKVSGDIRVRAQADLFAADNAEFAYLDFVTVNDKGGIGKAGQSALLNTTEDRIRTRVRARVGADIKLTDSFSAGLRLATGNFRDPVSTNQTLSQAGGRYSFGVDQAYLRYDARSTADFSRLTVTAGRIANPFFSSDLVYDNDLSFEGFSGTGRMGIGDRPSRHNAYLTMGAFPLEEVELSKDDKWLYGAQTGVDWTFDNRSKLRGAVAYYHYANTVGQRNSLDSTTYDFTAPKWLQKGNTLFDIRNDADPATNLFALAADYQLLNVVLGYDLPMFDGYQLSFFADYVKNMGFDRQEVAARIGSSIDDRTDGYQIEVGFGRPKVDRPGAWRASVRYRYLERDAVLDAFTDSDFHLGGTDAQGYSLRADYGLAKNVYLSLRYLSANEIDGPPLGIDVLMLDLNGQF
jgi:polyhydroxyalkanoate synthesis regulator phasin